MSSIVCERRSRFDIYTNHNLAAASDILERELCIKIPQIFNLYFELHYESKFFDFLWKFALNWSEISVHTRAAKRS